MKINSCRGMSTATYGTGRPLADSAGGCRVAQRAEECEAAQQGSHDRFTQVSRKTLLLLWWIDDGNVVFVRSTLARQGHMRLRACRWVCCSTLLTSYEKSLTPSTVAMGLLL